MAAKLKDMEQELSHVHAQLARKDSDRVQWLEAEWSSKCLQLQESLREQTQIAVRCRRSYASTASALESREAALGEALQRAREAEAALETTRGELARVKEEAAQKARKLSTRDGMVERRDQKLACIPQLRADLLEATDSIAVLRPRVDELEKQVSAKDKLLAEAEIKLAERLTTIRKYVGMQGGRPVINRDEDELLECGASMASHCESRMTSRVLAAIGEVGVEGCVSNEALMDALVLGGWLETAWESEVMWEKRMEWLDELSNDLADVWNDALTLKIRDKLLISYPTTRSTTYASSSRIIASATGLYLACGPQTRGLGSV